MKTLRPSAFLAAASLLAASALHAADGTWTSTAGGIWSTGFSGGIPADGTDAIATFGSDITATTAVSLDSARTAGTINFNDTGASGDSSWTINSANSSILTLATSSGAPVINLGAPNGNTSDIISVALAGTQGLTVNATSSTGNQAALRLSGSLASLSGILTINGGRVDNNGGSSLGGLTSVTVASGGQIGLWGTGTYTQNFTLAGNGHGESGYGVAIRGGNSTKTTTISGTVTLAGNATVGADTGGALVFSNVIGESVAGSRLIIGDTSQKGSVALSGANTYTGGTAVKAGTLVLDYATNNATSIGAGGLTLGGLGTNTAVQIKGNAAAATTLSKDLTLNAGANTLSLATKTGQTTAFTATSLTRNGGSLEIQTSGTGTAIVTLAGTVANTAQINNWVVYNNTFAATDGSNNLIAGSTLNNGNGAKDLSLWVSGTTQYASTSIAFANSVGAGVSIDGVTFMHAGTRTVTVGTGNTLTLNKGVIVSSTVGASASTITGGAIQGSASGQLTLLNNNSNSLTISSVITDNGGPTGLTASGAGTVILGALNTYTGVTTVSAGTLTIADTGAIKVAGANGVVVASGAILTLNGKLELTSGTDSIANAGTINFDTNGCSILANNLFDTGLAGNTYRLITGGTLNNTGAVTVDLAGSSVWTSASLDASGLITFTAVPEPSTYGLLGAGALGAASLARRRRKRTIDVA